MVSVASDYTWYFPSLLHLERQGGWIACLQTLSKVKEGAGELHGVGCVGFCAWSQEKREKGMLSPLWQIPQAWRTWHRHSGSSVPTGEPWGNPTDPAKLSWGF